MRANDATNLDRAASRGAVVGGDDDCEHPSDAEPTSDTWVPPRSIGIRSVTARSSRGERDTSRAHDGF